MAPEVLKKNYNEKCDLWSCGVVLYIMLCGRPPFEGKTEKQILEKVVRGLWEFKHQEWVYVSEEAKDLIKKLLVVDPKARLSAEEALQHPWFAKIAENNLDKPLAIQTLNSLKNFRV